MLIFAGTWINLMEAYASENYKAGDWGQIGYTAPGVQGTGSGDYSSNEFQYTGGVTSGKGTWGVRNLHKLNDCAATASGATAWKLEATVQSEGSTTAGQVSITKPTQGNTAACVALTPSFDKLLK